MMKVSYLQNAFSRLPKNNNMAYSRVLMAGKDLLIDALDHHVKVKNTVSLAHRGNAEFCLKKN